MNRHPSRKFRRIFFLSILCAAGLLFTGCATSELLEKTRKTADYPDLKTGQTRIYADRKSENNASPGFGVPYQLKIDEKKKMNFPLSTTGTVFIRPDSKKRRDPHYQALVTILDSRNIIRLESVRVHVEPGCGKPEARFRIEFELPEIGIDFEKREYDLRSGIMIPSYKEFFGKSGESDYLFPLIVEKAWKEKFGWHIDSRRMMRPVAWLDANGNPAKKYCPDGYPGLLLAVKPTRSDIKYVRISKNIMDFNGLKDIPVYYKGNFAEISVLVKDVQIVPGKYDMTQWSALNIPSSELVLHLRATEQEYKNPLWVRLIGFPFTIALDTAAAIVSVPAFILAAPAGCIMFIKDHSY